MSIPEYGPSFTIYHGTTARQCPECAGVLVRTSRLPLDRLMSLFKPVHRYRCQDFACHWEGQLPIDRLAIAHGDWMEEADRPRLTVAALVFWAIIVAALVVVLWPGLVDLLSEPSATMLLP